MPDPASFQLQIARDAATLLPLSCAGWLYQVLHAATSCKGCTTSHVCANCQRCSSSSNVQCPARLPPYLFCRTSVELPSSDNRADRGQRANGTVSWHAHLGDALKQVRGDGETMPPRAPPGAEDGLDCNIRSGAETCTIECVASAALVCQPCLL